MIKWLIRFLTKDKCPKCKKYLNETMQFKLDEYNYCDCDKCGIHINSYLR